jgi:16S rRNA (cytosine1402-N4)-methyltransferase
MHLLRISTLCLGNRAVAVCRWLSPAATARFSSQKAESIGHVPVLLEHVMSVLNPAAGERVVDCTAGLGGHAVAIAQRLGPAGSITLLDADASNLQVAANRVRSALPADAPSVHVHHMNFRDVSCVAPKGSVDIIIADLGVCSSQIDNLSRGFSFRTNTKSADVHSLTDADAPLDMRFDQSSTSSSVPVSDWLRRTKTFDVADALMTLGEVRPSAARRIAAAIEANAPVTSTKQLRDIVVQQTGEVQPPLAQVRNSRRLLPSPRETYPRHMSAGISGFSNGCE